MQRGNTLSLGTQSDQLGPILAQSASLKLYHVMSLYLRTLCGA
jgi:hypothetical protein